MINFKEITLQSIGQWNYILPALGVSAEALTNKHKPCPACGGKDRFRYDDKQGRGTFVCGQLDGLSEPTRVFRRQFILSHATLADSSNRR